MRILYIGSGAVNLALAGWMHSGISRTSFLVSSSDHELIRTQAFRCRLPGDQNFRVYPCHAMGSLDKAECPDLVVFGVKNSMLDIVIPSVLEAFGKDVPVMSVLNGITHIRKISDVFSNTMFASIAFNAYRTSSVASVAVGGALVLSATDHGIVPIRQIYKILRKKIGVSLSEDPMDVAHCKLIFNLNNALLTMVGFHEYRERQLPELQYLMTRMLWEGVKVLNKQGVKEFRIPSTPSWLMLRLMRFLPQAITLPIFRRKMKVTAINSMAQDVQNGAATTEFDDLNGYFIQMADRAGVEVPCNRAVYRLFPEWLSKGRASVLPAELLVAVKADSSL